MEQLYVLVNQEVYDLTDAAVVVGPPGLNSYMNQYRADRLKTQLARGLIYSSVPELTVGCIAQISIPLWLAKRKELNVNDSLPIATKVEESN